MDEAEALRQQGKLIQAQRICETVLQRYPDYVGMLHTLGLVLADRGHFKQSLAPLVQAAMLNPRDWRTLTALSGVYLRLGAAETAIRTLEQAREIEPEDASIHATLGEILYATREYEAAAAAYERALSRAPELHDIHIKLAECHLHMGRAAPAAKAALAVLERDPSKMSPLDILSRVPDDLHDIDVLRRLDAARNNSTDSDEVWGARVAFTRARLLDAKGDHDRAWTNLETANAHKARLFAEEQARDAANRDTFLERLASVKPLPEPKGKPEAGHTVTLYVLGPSRSGKTTAESIVATLPGVSRGFENRLLEVAVRQTFQDAGLLSRDWIGDLPIPLEKPFQDNYARELKARAADAAIFTNTHPGHMSAAVRLAAFVPEARFMLMRRNVDDLALRIYMKNYDSGNSYAYALPAIRAYLDWYNAMIDAAMQLMPGRCAQVSYEEMVADPSCVRARAAALCGIEDGGGDLPAVPDDRGCADPYSQWMKSAG
ncbi:tetratricopeptide repeat protein [Tepidamorphus sp. 3E244]|uniref:tetratricopeptide repeat-containing sulfotransferase family protein n=1 Tax=Tepidamorphus sp. 3E244 TaxID=3385498 RepID=UPI0038FD014B